MNAMKLCIYVAVLFQLAVGMMVQYNNRIDSAAFVLHMLLKNQIIIENDELLLNDVLQFVFRPFLAELEKVLEDMNVADNWEKSGYNGTWQHKIKKNIFEYVFEEACIDPDTQFVKISWKAGYSDCPTILAGGKTYTTNANFTLKDVFGKLVNQPREVTWTCHNYGQGYGSLLKMTMK